MSLSLGAFWRGFASIAKGEKGIITQETHSCPLMCVTIVEKVVILSKRMKVGERRRGRPRWRMQGEEIRGIMKLMLLSALSGFTAAD